MFVVTFDTLEDHWTLIRKIVSVFMDCFPSTGFSFNALKMNE